MKKGPQMDINTNRQLITHYTSRFIVCWGSTVCFLKALQGLEGHLDPLKNISPSASWDKEFLTGFYLLAKEL